MRRLVVSAALVLVVAGCGGDPKAHPSPRPSSPTTSSPSTPAPPVMPEAAKANTKAGAVAFVKHYIDLINYAQATGDVDSLARMEAKDCRSCENARQTLADIYGSGGHIEGGSLKATIDAASRRPDLRGWTIFAVVSFGPQQIVKPTGNTTLNGGRSVMTIVARHYPSGWLVRQWSRAS